MNEASAVPEIRLAGGRGESVRALLVQAKRRRDLAAVFLRRLVEICP